MVVYESCHLERVNCALFNVQGICLNIQATVCHNKRFTCNKNCIYLIPLEDVYALAGLFKMSIPSRDVYVTGVTAGFLRSGNCNNRFSCRARKNSPENDKKGALIDRPEKLQK